MNKHSIPKGGVMLCHLDDEASRKNDYLEDEVYDSLFWHILFCGPAVVPAPWLLNNKNLDRLFGQYEGASRPLQRSAEMHELLSLGLIIPVAFGGGATTLGKVADGILESWDNDNKMVVHMTRDEISRRAELIGEFACVETPDLRSEVFTKSQILFSSPKLSKWLRDAKAEPGDEKRLINIVERSTELVASDSNLGRPTQGIRRSKLYRELQWERRSELIDRATDIADAAYYLAFQEKLGVSLAMPGPVLRVCTIFGDIGESLLGNSESKTVTSNVPSPSSSGIRISEAISHFESHPTRARWLHEYQARITEGDLDVSKNSVQISLAVDLTRLASEYLQIGGQKKRLQLLAKASADYYGDVTLAWAGIAGVALGVVAMGFDVLKHRMQTHGVESRRDFLRGIMMIGPCAGAIGTTIGAGVEYGRHHLDGNKSAPRNAVAVARTFTLAGPR